ncbi:MAG: hypothetical protein IT385_30255 [Deltaproteobacteria bacterium]|nr:hypothetical protein [Deltaproteobacteria bacterium]
MLVTGFGPFEDVEDNASGRVAERLRGARIAGHEVVAEVLPTIFGRATARVSELVREVSPRAVVALGVSRDPWPRLERRAASTVTSARPDVAGEVWLGRRLGSMDLENAGARETWLAAARAVAPEARWSEDCGGYVCNAVHHALLEASASGVPSLFVHIPRASDPASIDHIGRLVGALIEVMVGEGA